MAVRTCLVTLAIGLLAVSAPAAAQLAPGDLIVGNSSASSPSVFLVDPLTGDRTLISGRHIVGPVSKGAGPGLRDVFGAEPLDAETLVVVDRNSSGAIEARVFLIDVASGDRTLVSGPGNPDRGSGPLLSEPRGLAVGPEGDYLVSDAAYNGIFRVDADTGDRALISNPSIGSGPVMQNPQGIAVGAAGLYVAAWVQSSGEAAIFHVDLATGDRTIVTSPSVGSGDPAPSGVGGNFRHIVVDTDGSLIVTAADAGGRWVYRVDPATGGRTTISSEAVGGGDDISLPNGVVIEPGGQIASVAWCLAAGCVFRVDPSTGDRTAFSASGSLGTGLSLDVPWSLSVFGVAPAVTSAPSSGITLIAFALVVVAAYSLIRRSSHAS